MTSHQPLGPGSRAVLRLTGLLAVVAGIVGMHGLANHGVGGMANTHPVIAATSTSSDAPVLDAGTAGTTDEVAVVLPAHIRQPPQEPIHP